ncbi:hypothetical protein [Streptomonospora salina]|uniref:Uncharacterized protein n=1 Tax=Streptomonospora salina TaxID=104205 RepID=A0A841EGH3_9ACTN|nr:hypothetical protein [Streptomonospora salina]MBB5998521.1 hypothetical protein [Streptomonospora salina]
MGYLKRCDGRIWIEFQTRRELMDRRRLEDTAADLVDRVREGVRP